MDVRRRRRDLELLAAGDGVAHVHGIPTRASAGLLFIGGREDDEAVADARDAVSLVQPDEICRGGGLSMSVCRELDFVVRFVCSLP
jgi:hypothetical protein